MRSKKVMTFEQWVFGTIDNPPIQGQWGPLHIATMLISIACIVGFYFLVKHVQNKELTKKIIVITLASLIFFFELTSRIVYFLMNHLELGNFSVLWILLPKPWCAISCWVLMAAVVVNKRFFYNFASLSALLCSLVYFSYPGVGFNNEYILYFNLYSIVTHALLLITSITFIVLGFTKFEYKGIWKVAICFAATFLYAFFEIFVLKIERDPLYFMPNGDIQAGILRISYGLYLFLYITVMLIYINAFYLVQDRKNVKSFFAKILKKA